MESFFCRGRSRRDRVTRAKHRRTAKPFLTYSTRKLPCAEARTDHRPVQRCHFLVVSRRHRPPPALLASELRHPHEPPPLLRQPRFKVINVVFGNLHGGCSAAIGRGRDSSVDKHISPVVKGIQVVSEGTVQLSSPLHERANHLDVTRAGRHVERRPLSMGRDTWETIGEV